MKTIILGILALVSINAFAAPADLQGRWLMTERYCTDGAAPDDLYVAGRDSISFEFVRNTLIATMQSNGKAWQDTSEYKADNRRIEILFETKKDSFLYTVGARELVLFAADFKDGTCHTGAGIMLVFTRQQ